MAKRSVCSWSRLATRAVATSSTKDAGPSSQCIDSHGAACVVLTSGVSAQRLAVDATNVYWTELTPRVGAVPKGGGSARTLMATGEAPGAIAADHTGVYVGLEGDGAVLSINASTGASARVSSVGQAPKNLALDDAYVYVATQVANIEAPGPSPIGLFRISRDGSTTDTLANGWVDGIVADTTGAYWGIERSGIFALLHGATTPIMLTANGGGVVAVDETYVYFREYTGNLSAAGRREIAVSRMPKTGAMQEPLYTSDDVGSVAVDATHLYVVKATGIGPTGQVVQLPKGGGAPTLVADKLADPVDMAIDDQSVYVVDFYAGAIVRVPKP
jgi:hypothetical protein